MPRKPRLGTTVRLKPVDIETLRKLAKKLGLEQQDILGTLINMCEVHDLLNKEWQERLTAALERGRREIERVQFEGDADRCHAIAQGEEKYKCVWGRQGKPPLIRLLERDYEASKVLCLSCKKTLLILEENAEYLKQIDNLKTKIQQKVDVSFKVPICHKGGILNEDSTEFSGCPKHRGENVSVEKFCRVYSSGLPCALFAQRVIAVADKASEIGSESNI